VADLRISDLPALAGGSLAAADVLPITDVSASTTKKITAKDLVQYGVTLIDANSIPSDKFDIVLDDGSVDTLALADGSVTAIKLADNSSGVVSAGVPAAGTRVGQLAVDTTDNLLYVWSGSAWIRVKAAGSVNTVNGDVTGLVLITVNQTDDVLSLDAELADTTASRQFLAGPTSGAGQVSQRQIVGLDLPPATGTDLGAISAGGGLTVDGGGVLSIDNSVTAQPARSLATWNEYGLVTGGSPIEGTDLPVATATTPGVVYPGGSLVVDGTGKVELPPDTVPGEYAKVTVNAEGLVKSGTTLTEDDIPDISADKIVGGEIGEDLLAECSVTAPKICDYATCLMQEDNPGAGDFLGQFWYTPSTAQLRVYSRGSGPQNIWLPVGFGALQANNLRWGGTYDADTDTIVSLTAIGVSEGLTAGQPFPAPSDAHSGLYFICQTPGDSMVQPSLNGINHTAGDWVLCLDSVQGWIHIDANGGGSGGGGGAQYLNDLLDVNIGGNGGPFSTAPRMALSGKQLLKYDSGDGMWKNTDLVDGGTF